MNEYDKDQILRDWMLNSVGGVVFAIRLIYFEKTENRDMYFVPLALETLDKHRIVDFDIVKDDFSSY